MPAIVEQIQRDALDPNVPVSALLRRVKLAAVKLGLGRVEDWVEHELNGYRGGGEVPAYRMLRGQPMALNEVRGWIPVSGHPTFMRQISELPCGQPIEELEQLARDDGNGDLMFPYPPEWVHELNKGQPFPFARIGLACDRSVVLGVIGSVRNLVTDWSLKLEQAGIMGTEFSFAPEERHKAQAGSMTITIGSIGAFTGNLGSGNTSGDITASSIDVDQVQRLVEQVRQYQGDLARAGANATDLDRDLSAIEREVTKPSPNSGVLRGLITDLRNTISGAAGSLVASGVIAIANQILGTGVPS